jgi:hypothetical protein
MINTRRKRKNTITKTNPMTKVVGFFVFEKRNEERKNFVPLPFQNTLQT